MKTKRSTISFLLTFIMVISLFTPINVAAASELSTTVNVAEIMKYGNTPLTLKSEELFAAGYNYGDILNVSFLNNALKLPLCNNYSDVDSGCPGVFVKGENILLAINMGDFATSYGIATKSTLEDGSIIWTLVDGVNAPINVSISMSEAGGYYDEYILHQLSYSNSRTDYPGLSDEQFANFRMVSTTGIGKGRLYRSASPINPKISRNKYADEAYKKVGVNVIMDLADSEDVARSYDGYDSSYYSNQQHIFLNMDVDFASDDFKTKLAKGLKFFADNPGVYGVHCTEGKDRAGFTTAIIECLMGASYDEVVSDYMVTFYNYYGITTDDVRYETIANSNIRKSLARAFEVTDIENTDLSRAAEKFIKSIGLSDEDIIKLKANLGSDAEEDDRENNIAAKANAVDKTGIIFTEGVDSLKYKEVGFIFEADGKTVRRSTNTVYTSINGSQFAVSDFDGAKYIYSFTIEDIADAETEIKVTPYFIGINGSEIKGKEETYSLARLNIDGTVVPMAVYSNDDTISNGAIVLYGANEIAENSPVEEKVTYGEPNKKETDIPKTEIVKEVLD